MFPSRTLTMHKKSCSEKKLLEVIDNENMNEFFSQPSAHELSLASELRIAEIIDDLQRRTTEELQNWTYGGSDSSESSRPSRDTNESQTPQYLGLPSKARFHNGDVVGSPVSYLPSSTLTSPNLRLGSTARRAKKSLQSLQQRRSRAFSISTTGSEAQTSKSPLTLFHKPSFQSFLKRLAKTPPPPELSIRDYALATPKTPPPAKAPDDAPIKAQAVLGIRGPSTLVPLLLVDEDRPDVDNDLPLLPIEARSRMSVTSTTVMPSKAAAVLGIEQFGLPPRSDTAPLEKQSPRKPRPRSLSDSDKFVKARPLTQIDHAKSMKRKPLPRDSPLLIPVGQHPAFMQLQNSKNQDEEEFKVMYRKTSTASSKVKIEAAKACEVTKLRTPSQDEILDELDTVLPLQPISVAVEQKA